ncbi:MAG: EF-hand domain-containing protein [Candidatus Sericytochromatia bacterium]|jgi:hypothetical protein|nr:EF-hand domain-containing protein [Candidatus Sericytochromatia bacterium]
MVSVNALASQIIRNYDTNRDGVIQLRGNKPETERLQRDFMPGQQYDTITLTRFNQDKLFAKADANNDGQVTRDELLGVIKLFDTNNDGELKNSGPFWNRKGEEKNYQKAYGEQGEIIDQHLIHHPPQPPLPHYPTHPNYPGSHPGHPHYPRAIGGSVGVMIA